MVFASGCYDLLFVHNNTNYDSLFELRDIIICENKEAKTRR